MRDAEALTVRPCRLGPQAGPARLDGGEHGIGVPVVENDAGVNAGVRGVAAVLADGRRAHDDGIGVPLPEVIDGVA